MLDCLKMVLDKKSAKRCFSVKMLTKGELQNVEDELGAM